MKRKIAAIFALISPAIRAGRRRRGRNAARLAAYRSVYRRFHRQAGAASSTAGYAVLAEFPSAVEAVRCAIDIQESCAPVTGLSAEPAR